MVSSVVVLKRPLIYFLAINNNTSNKNGFIIFKLVVLFEDKNSFRKHRVVYFFLQISTHTNQRVIDEAYNFTWLAGQRALMVKQREYI